MRLTNKVAIVAGGATGMGRLTTQVLAREGAKVVVADLIIEEANKVVEEIKDEGAEAIAVKVDVTKFDDAQRMAKTTLDTFSQIDILVNVAGGSAGPVIRTKLAPFVESTPERWNDMVTLNLIGALNCTRAVVNHRTAQTH